MARDRPKHTLSPIKRKAGKEIKAVENKEYQRLEAEAAVKRAVSDIVTFKAASCKEYNAAEGQEMARYLRQCKKEIAIKLDEAIRVFENWR